MNKNVKHTLYLILKAVSYTHLDVYKRQYVNSTFRTNKYHDYWLPFTVQKNYCALLIVLQNGIKNVRNYR